MAENEGMRRFWDEKARENALYYVSSYREYGQEDPEEFYAWGTRLVDQFLTESDIDFRGDETALEIGCGVGRLSQALARRFARVVALDVSQEMIRRARDQFVRTSNLEFRVGNGLDLSPQPDQSVDLVFSYIVLQHIPDPAVALGYLREAGRVLRPGGHLHAQFNNLPPARRGLGLKRGLRRVLDRVRPTPPPSGPRGLDDPAWVGSRLTLDQVRSTCDEAGLAVLQIRGEGTQYCWVTAQRA